MDNDFDGGDSEAFSVCSSPLSDPVHTVVLKASSRATDGNTIPAISAKYERVFSSAKKMITQELNSLTEDIIQACEYLKSWWDTGVIAECGRKRMRMRTFRAC
jgi:hAT family C-terminal dimerisation region